MTSNGSGVDFGGQPRRDRAAGVLRRLLPLLRGLVSVLILGLLWRIVDGPEVLRLLRQAQPGWIVAALVAANLQTVLSALRWRMTAAALGQSFGKGQAVGEYYLSQLVNLTLPLGILGDAGRAVRMRHHAGMVRAGQAVMIERMAGQIALFAVLLAGIAVWPLVPEAAALPDWVARMGIGIALGAALLGGGLATARHVPGPVSRAARGFVDAARRSLFARDLWPRQVGLGLLIVGCNLATVAFCARATGTALGLTAIVTIVPLMLLTMMIPVSIAGWGLREGAAAALWPVVGATATAGIAASIAFGLVILVASLPGVVVLLARGPVHPPRAAAPPSAGDGRPAAGTARAPRTPLRGKRPG